MDLKLYFFESLLLSISSIIPGLVLLSKFKEKNETSTFFWGTGLIMLGLANMFEMIWALEIVGKVPLLIFFRYNFVSIALIFFMFYGTMILYVNKFKAFLISASYYLLSIIVQHYFTFVVQSQKELAMWHVFLFVIPPCLIFTIFYFIYFIELKNGINLLLSGLWLFYAIMSPFYFIFFNEQAEFTIGSSVVYLLVLLDYVLIGFCYSNIAFRNINTLDEITDLNGRGVPMKLIEFMSVYFGEEGSRKRIHKELEKLKITNIEEIPELNKREFIDHLIGDNFLSVASGPRLMMIKSKLLNIFEIKLDMMLDQTIAKPMNETNMEQGYV